MRLNELLCRAVAAAGLCLAAAPAAQAQSDTATTPVVVELFTSQGCSSCPPADKLLGELSEREGVIALSFHVDYWDYLGWRDSFAAAENTLRQRAYVQALGARSLFTPMMVVQGAGGMVGSHRKTVKMAVAGQAARPLPAAVILTRDGDSLAIHVSPVQGADAEGGEIWLFAYDGPLSQEIERGELGGHTLTYHNVVRETRTLGDWNGADVRLEAAIDPARKGYAVIVQGHELGPVLGAATIETDSGI